jgi:hypothetical protein
VIYGKSGSIEKVILKQREKETNQCLAFLRPIPIVEQKIKITFITIN